MATPNPDAPQIAQTVRVDQRQDRLHRLPNDEAGPSRESTEWTGPFYFIQAADTQFGLIDRYIKKVQPVTWDEEIRLSELLIEKCNRMQPKPKFMVVCGDLTDADPSGGLRREQVHDFKRIFASLNSDIPLVCVCGNHDVGDEPTMDLIAKYQADFGDDYFYFVTGGILFIVINSQFYQHRANVEEYARQQDKWLIEVLERCKQFKYSFVFEHIPWFLQQPNEEDEYFNISLETRMEWLKRFHEAGVTKIMCGHYHRNAGGWYENMELVVTSAVGAQLGKEKSGARVVRVLPESVDHQYYALEDLPDRVDLQ